MREESARTDSISSELGRMPFASVCRVRVSKPALLQGVPRHSCARYEPALHCALPLAHHRTHGRTRPSLVVNLEDR